MLSVGSRSRPCYLFTASCACHQELYARSHGLSDSRLRYVRSHLLTDGRKSDFGRRSIEELTELLEALFKRLHVLIVGPGLGREHHMQGFARLAIQLARQHNIYLILDADALLLIQEDPEIIRGYSRAVITPNVAEFTHTCEALVPTLRNLLICAHGFGIASSCKDE